jgi:hypothetical protein
LADATAFNVVGDPMFCPWPMEHVGDLSDGFVSSRVSSSEEVMPFHHDGLMDFIVWWNNQFV